MPDKKRKPKRPATVTASSSLNKKEIETALKNAKNAVAKKMGIPVAQLSSDVIQNIDSAVKDSLSSRMNSMIRHDADRAVKETVLAGAQPLEMLDSRITAAQAGVRFVSTDAKVEAVLDDTAKLLWKKYQALIKAGFTDAQAFELILAEVAGRSSRNK
jgi:hypothetical protein